MTKLLAMALCLTVFSAFADENVIYSKTYSKRTSWELFRSQYRVNTELGRAWIKLELVEDDWTEEDLNYDDVRVMPEGMHYDKTTGDIKIFDTVCATTVRTRRKIKIYPTGKCLLRDSESRIQVDDGYNMVTKKRLNVYLTVL